MLRFGKSHIEALAQCFVLEVEELLRKVEVHASICIMLRKSWTQAPDIASRK